MYNFPLKQRAWTLWRAETKHNAKCFQQQHISSANIAPKDTPPPTTTTETINNHSNTFHFCPSG